MLERHDRNDFEFYCIAHGLSDNSAERARLAQACENFVDAQIAGDRAIAQRMADLNIDIAIDLDGYTTDSRPSIFAFRPTPVQVHFLGYPGTLASPHIDYLIADAIVIPPGEEIHYGEQIIRMPASYQPNGKRWQGPPVTRTDLGLPETGLVFGCFNNAFKITPDVFAIWMRLLMRVPASILWLLGFNDTARTNLSREAEAHGVDPARLHFAPVVDAASHIARLSHMDIALDTFMYGAHTTASDALWAGAPIVTKIGNTFASRVAASLLTAAGLADLIAKTPEEYENLALSLATDPAKLEQMKQRVAQARDASPVFDATGFARHLESAYRHIWERHEAGKDPEGFSVQP